MDPFFNELWKPEKRRSNGRLVSEAITPEDIVELKHGRKRSRKHSHLSVMTALQVSPDDPKSVEKFSRNSKESYEDLNRTKKQQRSRQIGVHKSKELIKQTSKESVKQVNNEAEDMKNNN